MRGSWNRATSSGYEIVLLQMKNGKPQAFETYVSGFLTDGSKTHADHVIAGACKNTAQAVMSQVTPESIKAAQHANVQCAAPLLTYSHIGMYK